MVHVTRCGFVSRGRGYRNRMPRSSTSSTATGSSSDPVLVTGATGFIGLETVRRLTEAGIPVRAMFRRRHRAALLSPLDVDLVCADLLEPESLRRAVDGCRAIIHLGGRATFESYDRLRPTLVEGTQHVIEAADAAGVERIVFGSSLFVHGPSDGPVVDADSSQTPILEYGRAKIEAEQRLAASSISTASIRLPHVYGWNDILFGIARSGWIPFPADMDTHFPHMHVSDAADALIAALDRHDVTGPVPIADDESVSWRHFFGVLRTYQPHLRVIELPPDPVRWLLSVIERLPASKPSMLTADTIRGWNLELAVAPGSTGTLGVSCRFPTVDAGIPAVLDAARPYRWRHPVFDRRGG